MPMRWLMTLMVGAILAWASLHALRAARTHDDLYWALQSLRLWGGAGSMPQAGWSGMRGRLEKARSIEPDNPQIEEFLGLLEVRRLDDPSRLHAAAAHYLRSLELRPVAANTWANLAEARYLVGDTGPTFRRALENAASLAPSNTQVQRVAALYGLAVFDEVGPDTRRAIESMVAGGMRRDPAMLLGVAQRRARLDVACRYLPGPPRKIDPKLSALCKS